MRLEFVWGILFCLAALSVAGGLSAAAYYRFMLHRLEKLQEKFLRGGTVKDSASRESRESKFVSKQKHILQMAENKEAQAVKEREQMASFLSDLSHQLKTPLANVIMCTELLQDEGINPADREEFVKRIKEQAEKMQWLMRTLLKGTRLEQGMVSFESGFYPIKETIAAGVGAVYAQACEKEIRLAVEDSEDCKLYHNVKWTAEALGNILENAVKYSPRGSEIRILLEPMEIYAKIVVEDEGPGIRPSEYAKVFRRFYRGKEVKNQDGSGLGLYIAQLILKSEKGYITVEKRRERGSRFSVYLLKVAETI